MQKENKKRKRITKTIRNDKVLGSIRKKVNRLVWIIDCSDYCLKNMKTKTTNKCQPATNQKVKTNRK